MDTYDLVVIGAGPAGQVAAELAASLRAPGADRRAEQARRGGHDHRRRTDQDPARSRAVPDRLRPGGGLRRPGGSAAGCRAADHPREDRAGARRPAGSRRHPARRARHRLPPGSRSTRRGPHRGVTSPDGVERELAARAVLVATGSRPTHYPGIPFDDPDVYDSDRSTRSRRCRGHRHRRRRPGRRRVRHGVHRARHSGDARQPVRSPAAGHRRRAGRAGGRRVRAARGRARPGRQREGWRADGG